MFLAMLPLAAAVAEAAPPWEIVPVPAEYRERCPVSDRWRVTADSEVFLGQTEIIRFTSAGVTWNFALVTDAALGEAFRSSAGAAPRRVTIVQAHGVSCDRLRQVTDLLERQAACEPAYCVVSLVQTMVPAPMPPVAPPPPPGTRPTPAMPPTFWVTSADYPPVAIRGFMHGMTAFRLQVAANGWVSGCEVTGSSGYPLLDATACMLISRRARFHPAKDADGVAVAGSWSSRFRWELLTETVPLNSWVITQRFRARPDGKISDCAQEMSGTTHQVGATCHTRGSVSPRDFGLGGKPAWIEARITHLLDGEQVGSPQPAGARILFRRAVRYAVDARGEIGGCEVIAESGRDILRMAAYDCHPGYAYEMPAVGAAAHNVTLVYTVTAEPAE